MTHKSKSIHCLALYGKLADICVGNTKTVCLAFCNARIKVSHVNTLEGCEWELRQYRDLGLGVEKHLVGRKPN